LNFRDKILGIDSALFIKDMVKIPPPHINPSFVKWPRGSDKYLFSWRSDLEGPPIFGWMEKESHFHLLLNSAFQNPIVNISATSTLRASKQASISPLPMSSPIYPRENIHLENATEYLGLGPRNSPKNLHIDNHKSEVPFDIRFLPMPDDSLIVAFSTKKGGAGLWAQGYARLTASEREGIRGLDNTALLQAPPGEESHDQKNWVPFEYEGRLLFMQKMDPLTIVEAYLPPLTPPSNRAGTSGGDGEGLSDQIKVIQVSPLMSDEVRPWKGHYGMPIRGGTPAVKIRGVYLTFFHTLLMFQFPFKIRTYFMGAMTFCAHPPFHPLSMSTVPIVHPSWYDGPWINIRLDYCVFPTSISVEVKANGEEGDHIWVTVGRQDNEGVLVKMNIDELFHSLDKIDGANEC